MPEKKATVPTDLLCGCAERKLPETYLDFRVKDHGRTTIFDVVTKERGLILGQVKWYGAWRCYAFCPKPDTVFEKECLRSIADFCEQHTKRQRQSWARRRRSG